MKLARKLLDLFAAQPAPRAPAVAPAPLLLALEPRIVYEASLGAAPAAHAGAAAGSHHHADPAFEAHSNPVPGEGKTPGSTSSDTTARDANASNRPGYRDGAGAAQRAAAGSTVPATSGMPANQVVFVDPNVTNYQELISGLPAGTAFVVLNPATDGLAQIAQYLEQHPGVAAIHLVTHGSEAQVEIGSTWLTSSSLSNYSAELAAIGKAMAPGGDFLIYGCDVAEGADGRALVDQIASATHLNVAASTDPTGAAALGGDWTLEYHVGDVKTPVIFSQTAEQDYGYLLTNTVETFTSGAATNFNSGATATFLLDGITYTIVDSVGLTTTMVQPDPSLTGLNGQSASENALWFDMMSVTGTSSITISMTDGKPFTIQSLNIDMAADANVSFLPNGQATGGITLASNGNWLVQTVELYNNGANPAFAGITSLTISGSNLTTTLGHIVYSEISPPLLTTSGGATTFTSLDSTTHTPVAIDTGLTITDAEATTAQSATITISGNDHPGEDVLAFSNTSAALYGNIAATSYNASTGTLTLASAGGTATIAQWQSALRAVTYVDTAAAPNTATRTISFTLNDGLASSTAVTKTITVDTPPIVTTTGGTITYAAGTSAVTVDSGVTVTDPSQTTQASATVSISGGFHSGDTLSFTPASGISSAYNPATGVLTLTPSGSATNAQWTSALESVVFSSTSAVYGNRTISFTVSDGSTNSATVTKTLDVIDPHPVITADSGSAAFVAGDNVTSTPVAVDAGLTLTDPASATVTQATVAITGNFQSGEDVLSFINGNSAMYGNIAVSSYNATTGVLTLASTGNTATLAQWRAALDAVTFTDTAITPINATRTISFSVTDTNGNTSNTATRTVTVTDTDQTPIVSTSGGTTAYTATLSAVSVDSGVVVSDLDNFTLASATVSITTGFASGDTLSFTPASGISGTYNSATGVLTLTSSSGTTTLAQWQAALESVQFGSTSTSYGNRTVSFTVNDGQKTSTAATHTVSVANPDPVITTSGTTTFVAGDNLPSPPVLVAAGLTLTDPTGATISQATVRITGGLASGEDVLAFANTDSATYGNIAASSYNAATGTLTLTSAGNSASLAQWQAALGQVTYTDTAIMPNTATRTISFSVTDTNGNASSPATRSVTVTAVDQTPIVTTTGSTTNYVAGSTAIIVDSGVTVSDLNNTTQSSGNVSITSGYASGDTLTFVNTSAATFGNIIASFNSATHVLTLTSAGATATTAQWQAAFDSVRFSAGASATPGNRTISFAVNDGTKTSAVSTQTVDVLGPPTVTTDPGSAAFVAGDNVTSTPVAIDSGLTVTDGIAPTLASATVAITGNFQSGEDMLAFSNTSSAVFGNIASSYNPGTGVLTLTSSGNTATLAQWQAALDAVTYTDTAITPNNATRTVSFTLVDTGGTTSNTATRTVTVIDTAQTPIVTTSGGTTNYVGGTSAVAVDGGVTVSDLDSTTQSAGTVSITSGYASGDTLSFTNTSTATFGNIIASYNAATGVLTLTSSGDTASDSQWANAFSAVTFSAGASAPPGNRTIAFVVNDGIQNSAAASHTVDVLGPPKVTTDPGSAAFVAGDNVASTPVAIDSGLTVTDGSAPTLATATVAITGNFHSGEDVLAFSNTDTTAFGNIASSYNPGTGVLTLTSSGNTATLAQWQAALDAVKYTDTAITPNNATRTVSFTLTDTAGITSNTATRTVTVADTDQTPILTTTGGTTNYVGGTSAVTVDGGVTVSDLDNTTQASAAVSITSGFASGDTLTFSNGGAFGNIAASYNAGTGVLTLTSAGATATNAQWQAAFDSVRFSTNASSTPGNRTISFAVSDGTKTSVAQTRTVDVLGPPTLTTAPGSAAFVAGDNVTSTPVAIDAGLTVTDGSAPTLATATVSITGNFHSGEDVLAFANTDSTTYGNIAAASYNATTGVLTLTSAGNTASLAQWQAALEAVTYTDTAITPNNATRTVSFSVTDTASVTSNAATRTVTVADTDQTPIVKTTSGTTNYLPGSSAAVVDGGANVTDRDNTTLASGSVAITTGFSAGDTLAFANTNSAAYGNIAASYDSATGTLTLTSAGSAATLAQWQAAFDAVKFSSTSSTYGTRTVSFTVNDGSKASAAAVKSVSVSNPAPVVTADPGSAAFVAGDNAASVPVTVDAGVSVSDPGAPTLASATVAITGNFHGSEDVLAFRNTSSATFGNIAGSYDAASGVLTLTSAGNAATLTQWQAALDAVTYADTAVKPDTSTRTIGFAVTDTNGNISNTATRTVTVTGTDQSPIVTTTGGATQYTAGAAAVTVDGGVTLSDADNTTQASGSVAITGGFASGDTLAFANTNSAAYGNITASFDAASGVLTLTSAGATATDAQWANALDAVTFATSSANAAPGSRTISFAVNDGTKTSHAATKSVAVSADAAPVVTGPGTAPPYTDGGSPVTLAGLSVSDRDNTTLASASVSVARGFVPGQDVLSFAGSAATGNIQGAYDARTGVLTLTSAGGTATLAQWTAALNAVSFAENGSAAPGARTLSVAVSDGVKTSAPFSMTVDVNGATSTPTTPGAPGSPGDNPGAVPAPTQPPVAPTAPAAPGAAPSTPAVPPHAFDSGSNRPSVLTEFEHAPQVGAPPMLPTITFTDSHAPARYLLLDRTSVAALPPDAALDPFASVTPLFQHLQTTPFVLNYEIAPDRAFSVDLANLLPGADGLRLGASSNVTVTLADGRPLPAWLHYDAAKGALTGTLPPGAAAVRIAVQERGADGSVIRNEVVLAPATRHAQQQHRTHAQGKGHDQAQGNAQDNAHAQQKPQTTPSPHASGGAPAPLAGRATEQAPVPAGKPSLAQQFARERASLHVARAPAHALTAGAAPTSQAAAAPVAERRA